jgi:hypothetical protein
MKGEISVWYIGGQTEGRITIVGGVDEGSTRTSREISVSSRIGSFLAIDEAKLLGGVT